MQEDAVIKNLHISGDITPSGSQNIIGSLVGNNKGSIEHCHFNGTVVGEDNIGGLVGINEATGNISHCSSTGMVTGGITGAMAVEFDLDPEDDIFKQGSRSLNFKYLTTAILKDCINHGKITAKKDYTGGIAGRMDLGIVYGCENYGDIESTEGDYVGGIAGASYATIDYSFALSSLTGKNYIGGIAGYGHDISNSYTLVDIIEATEWVGTIAGKAEGKVSNNYYVHETIAAIDGISYSEKASPLAYTELLQVESLPDPFTDFHLTFIADGNIVEKIPF